MFLLFLDTETTGLPETRGYGQYFSFKDLRKYDSSRIVQLACVFCELADGKITELESQDWIVKPDDFKVAKTEIHGITQELAEEKGIPFIELVDRIWPMLERADYFIAHNCLFDKHILLSELFRHGLVDKYPVLQAKREFCTSRRLTNITKIKKGEQYKQPKLIELYQYVFAEEPSEKLHNAMGDVRVMLLCFIELVRRGNIVVVDNELQVIDWT